MPEHTSSSADHCETGEQRGGSLRDEAKNRLHDTKEEIKHRVTDARREAAERAQRAAREARAKLTSRARSAAASGVEGVTTSCRDVGDALREASRTLRERDDTRVASYVDSAADGVDRARRYLEDRSPEQLASDVGDVVRRNPGLVLGGALAIGLLTGRFLRASSPQRQEREWDRPWDAERRAAEARRGYDESGFASGSEIGGEPSGGTPGTASYRPGSSTGAPYGGGTGSTYGQQNSPPPPQGQEGDAL